ncbi:MAG: hypothetical protein MHM6MM_008387 [Cercozoa sp. M6MM]
MPRFLCHLVHTDDRSYVDFRVSELEAVAGMVGASIEFDRAAAADLSQPFLWVSLPSEEAAEAIAKRATQVRAFYDVYAFCDNLSPDECIEQAAAEAERRKQAGEGSEFRDTFRLCVDYFGRRCSSELRMKLIEKMATTLPFEGAVDLKNAKRVFKLIVDLGHNAGLVELDEDGKKRKKHLSLDKLTPRQVFFVRVVAEGTGRQDVQQYSLKKRGYIGPTSTDAELAAIMSNMAQVKRGDLVMDMFVGTGSLLVAAAAQGAVCLGQDIDIRVLYSFCSLSSVLCVCCFSLAKVVCVLSLTGTAVLCRHAANSRRRNGPLWPRRRLLRARPSATTLRPTNCHLLNWSARTTPRPRGSTRPSWTPS